LVAGKVVQRQTGRHASYLPTDPTIFFDREGREVHTGFPPRHAPELVKLLAWIDELGLRDELPMATLIELAIEQGGIDLGRIAEDELVAECYRAVRDAVVLIASKMTAREFFVAGQTRGFAVGMVLSPDEVMVDEHLVARGYPASVFQPQLDRNVTHPGLPIRFTGSPGQIRHAPLLGSSQPAFTSSPIN
jgi:crotonobetainyl-CoA:carnitine CoA-transferase CaiB-like acyl-CoA transferase